MILKDGKPWLENFQFQCDRCGKIGEPCCAPTVIRDHDGERPTFIKAGQFCHACVLDVMNQQAEA